MTRTCELHQSIRNLAVEGIISEDIARHFTTGENRTIEVSDMDNVEGDPVLLCILTDCSGSMDMSKDLVFRTHRIMLDELRKSAFARRGLLHICQYLFNSSPKNLNPFTPLSPVKGNDKVTVLDVSNYVPSGRTALYQTLHSSLQDLLVMLSYLRTTGGLSPQCSVALITDGEDTEGGVDPSVIRTLFEELRKKDILKSSVLVGLLNSNLTRAKLETIQQTLRFETLISLTNSDDARSIRSVYRS